MKITIEKWEDGYVIKNEGMPVFWAKTLKTLWQRSVELFANMKG